MKINNNLINCIYKNSESFEIYCVDKKAFELIKAQVAKAITEHNAEYHRCIKCGYLPEEMTIEIVNSIQTEEDKLLVYLPYEIYSEYKISEHYTEFHNIF